VVLSEQGQARLKSQAKEALRKVAQATYVRLKTMYGFRMQGGVMADAYRTKEEFEGASAKNPKTEMFKARNMVLGLDAAGNIIEIEMTSIAGQSFRRSLPGGAQGPVAARWGGGWGAVEVDSEFRVKAIHSHEKMGDGPLSHWSEFRDDNRLYPIKRNRFPGFSRFLSWVNPQAGTFVLLPSKKVQAQVDEVEGGLTRVQIKPWLLTLGLALNVASGFLYSPWSLPLTAPVQSANVSDRVSALVGEGAIDEELPPVLEELWTVLNFFIFSKIVPQLQEKLYDPSGYPQMVAKDPPSILDRIIYYVTLTLLGRNKDRLVEVDTERDKPTRRVLTLGAKALRREADRIKEDLENQRQRALAGFKGGIEVRETTLQPGVFGDWRQTRLLTLAKGQDYEKTLKTLESLGVRFAPDGSFTFEVVPMGSRITGSRISSIDEARESLERSQIAGRDHALHDEMAWGEGGMARWRFDQGDLKDRELLPGRKALDAWREKVLKEMNSGSKVLWDAESRTLVESQGRWLYNPATRSFVQFGADGKPAEVWQAVASHAWARENYRREKRRYEFFQSFPELLASGGVVSVDGSGEVVALELGPEAVEDFKRAHPQVQKAGQEGAVLEGPDGGSIYLVPAPSQNSDNGFRQEEEKSDSAKNDPSAQNPLRKPMEPAGFLKGTGAKR
jgi:hypothetical protein